MIVTGYVRLDRASRPHDEYRRLGSQLLALGEPITAFLDDWQGTPMCAGGDVIVSRASLKGCWMHPLAIAGRPPAHRNPEKDTPEFLTVQAEKSAWLARAAIGAANGEVLGWVDFGILHVAGVRIDAIERWWRRIGGADPSKITVPSIWGPPQSLPGHDSVAWHCAGGALIVPRNLAGWFHDQVQWEAEMLLRDAGAITWEVNLWARVAFRHPERFGWYGCDHDGSMFNNGP